MRRICRLGRGRFCRQGPPREFTKLAALLRRFFLRMAEEGQGITLIIDFAEKVVPCSPDSYASLDEKLVDP